MSPICQPATYFANGRKALAAAVSTRLNLAYTVLIFFNSFAYGISVNLLGATLIDLGFVYKLSVSVLSQLLLVNALGYMIGALVGHSYRWLNRQFMLTFFSFLIAITSAGLPHYRKTGILFVALALNGFGGGAWDSSHTAWLADLWPSASGPVLQANQFLFGVGTTASPLLASNFIFGEAEWLSSNRTRLTAEIRRQYLAVPFAVNGMVQFVAPLLFLILFFNHRYQLPHSQTPAPPKPRNSLTLDGNHLDLSVSLPTATPTARLIPHRSLKLALCSLCIASYFTAEANYFPYCTALFQYLEVGLTAYQSAHVTSVLSLCYTIGPLITAFISLVITPDTILIYHYAFTLSGLALLFFGRLSLPFIYTGSALLGYGFSAMVPALNSFVQSHLGLNDTICSAFSFLSGSASLLIPLILAPTFETHPLLLLYLEVAFIVLSLILFIAIRIWLHIEAKR